MKKAVFVKAAYYWSDLVESDVGEQFKIVERRSGIGFRSRAEFERVFAPGNLVILESVSETEWTQADI